MEKLYKVAFNLNGEEKIGNIIAHNTTELHRDFGMRFHINRIISVGLPHLED